MNYWIAGLALLVLLSCRIDCSKLPDNRPVLVLPVRVEPTPTQACEMQEAYIELIQERLRACEDMREQTPAWPTDY